MGQNDIDSDVGNICDASYSNIANASSLFKNQQPRTTSQLQS